MNRGLAILIGASMVSIPPASARGHDLVRDLLGISMPVLQPGEEPAASAPDAPPRRPVKVSGLGQGQWIFDSDLDDDAGSVAVARAGLDVSVEFPIAQRSALEFGASYEVSDYQFGGNGTGSQTFLPTTGSQSDPFDALHSLDLTVRFSTQETQRFGWAVAARVGYAGEPGAEFEDALTYGVLAGVQYALSESVQIGGSFGIQTRLEDEALVIPVPNLRWRIDEQWMLRVGPMPMAELSYQATERLGLAVSAGYTSRDWRLDDDPVGREDANGVFRDTGWPLMFKARWNAIDRLRFEGGVGAMFFRQLKVFDEGGDEIRDVEVDPSMLISLGISATF